MGEEHDRRIAMASSKRITEDERREVNCLFCKPQSMKTGIKYFSQILLVAHGRKPSKSRFHGPIRRRISEEDKRNV